MRKEFVVQGEVFLLKEFGHLPVYSEFSGNCGIISIPSCSESTLLSVLEKIIAEGYEVVSRPARDGDRDWLFHVKGRMVNNFL